MKKISLFFVTVVILIFLVANLVFSAMAVGTSISNATSINMGTVYSDSITSANPEDYYKITLPSSGRVKINFTSYMRYYCAYIYDSNGEEMWYTSQNEWLSTTGMRKDIHSIDLEKGEYYIRVTGYYYYNANKNYASTGTYSFSVDFIDSFSNVSEPNNSILQAKSILFGKDILGQIAVNDREDYYKVTLPSSGRIYIDFTSYMRYYCVYIYDSNGEEMWFTSQNELDSTIGVRKDTYFVDLEKGEYYIRVTGYYYYNSNKNYASTGMYDFSVDYINSNSNFSEPNDSILQAKSISFNKDIDGQIAVNDRKDYYKIKLSSPTKIKINFTSYMRYYCAYIYDENGEEIWCTSQNEWDSSLGIRKDIYLVDLKAGEYYICITGYYYSNANKNYASTGNYTLKISENVVVPIVVGLSSSETNNSITLKWEKAIGATGYQIYKYNSKTKNYTLVKTTGSTTCTFSNLGSGLRSYYKVRAYITRNGTTYYGNNSSVYYVSTKPLQTTEFDSTQTSSSITLNWNKVEGATGYRLYFYSSKKNTYIKISDVTETKHTIKNLSGKKIKAGTTYKFAIKPYFKGSKTVWCSSLKYITTSTKPSKPKIKSLKSSKKKTAVASWKKVTGATRYQVQYSTSKSFKKKTTKTTKSTKLTIKKLKSKKNYYVRVRAYKVVNGEKLYGSWSSVKSIKVK